VRQVLVESVLLSLAGAAVGLLLAMWLTDFLAAAAPEGFALPIESATPVLDGRVLAFTALAALATGVLFGAAPALRASDADLVTALKGETRSVAVGRHRVPLRSVLAAVQVALSVILLVGAGLLTRTLLNASRVAPGFAPDGVVLATLELSRQGYERERGRQLYGQLLERLTGAPGMQHVALAYSVPVQSGGMSNSIVIEGYEPKPGEEMRSDANIIAGDYFQAMGIPFLRGRDFGAADVAEAPQVAIINQGFAEKFWPGQDPIGKWIGDINARVVGVVGDTRNHSLREPPPLTVYRPLSQFYMSSITVVARTTLPSAAALQTVRAAVAELDRELPVFRMRTLRDKLGAALARERVLAALLSAFALLALVLSAAGLYSLISYTVQARTREWGIRIALGARAGDVLRVVQRQGVVLALAGLAVGLAGAYALTRFATTLLFGVAPTDLPTYALAALTLLAVALAAGYLPARRATRIDPVVALKSE
jgi:predicted permease